MATVEVGPFRLIDPPEGQEAIIRAAIDAIDYPWERLEPALSKDSDKVVLVEWTDTGQGTSGLFYGYSYEIHLSNRNYHLDGGAAFVFAHEVGHLVDRATLDDEARDGLIDLYHSPGASDKHLGETMNDDVHPWSHEQPHNENWSGAGNEYLFRTHEAYADSFVAAFAPTIWNGTLFPPDSGLGDRSGWNGRFVHWTDDLAEVRRLTLLRDMTPEPPPEPAPTPKPVEPKEPAVRMRDIKDVTWDHPKARMILRAINLGLMRLNRNGEFRPGRRVTRAQMAESLVRLHDKME